MEPNLNQIVRNVDRSTASLRVPSALATFNRAMGWISVLAGAFFLAGFAWFLHRLHVDEAVFKRATAQGRVTENRYERTHLRIGSFPYGYHAMAQFGSQTGATVTVKDWVQSRPPLFIVGQTVTVYYDPEAPEHAVIDHGTKVLALFSIPFVMGFLMLLGGVQRLTRARSAMGEVGSTRAIS